MSNYSVKIPSIDKISKEEKLVKMPFLENGEKRKQVNLATIDNFFMDKNFKNKSNFYDYLNKIGYAIKRDGKNPYVSYNYKRKERSVEVIYDYCEYIDFFSRYYQIFKRADDYNEIEKDIIMDYEDIHLEVMNFVSTFDKKVQMGELIPAISVNPKINQSITNCLSNYATASKAKEDNNGFMFDNQRQAMKIGHSIIRSYKFIRSFIIGLENKEKMMTKLGLSREKVLKYNELLKECSKIVEESNQQQLNIFNEDSYPLEDLDYVRSLNNQKKK